MTKDDRPVLVYTTFASLDDAKRVGDALVAARLAACVNIFPGMVSIYEWKGTRELADDIAEVGRVDVDRPIGRVDGLSVDEVGKG